MKLKHLHYGWVIVISGASIHVINSFVAFTFGVFFKPLTTEFNWERASLSGAYSVYMVLFGLMGIFAGRLSDKYGPRIPVTIGGTLTGAGFLLMSQINSLWQVYLIWGLIMGIGSSGHVVPIISTIPRWFARKRGTAIGIAFAGFGVGAIISPPLAQWLISAFDWRQAIATLGLITLAVIIPLAQFLKHSPQRTGLKPHGENGTTENKETPTSTVEELSFAQATKTRRFWTFGLIIFCWLFCVQVIIVHIVPNAIDAGIPEVAAASILSVIGGVSIIGRLFIGLISSRLGSRLTLTACVAVIALNLILLLFARDIWVFLAFAVIFGLAYGGVVSLQPVVTAELFGLNTLGMIFAGTMLFGTAGGAVGPFLAGSIFDATGSYTLPFSICIILGVTAVILSLILLRYRAKTYTAVPV